MHQPVLDGGIKHGQKLRMPFSRMFQRPLECRIELRAQPLIVRSDLRTRRPIARLIRGKSAANWIDSKCEKLIEGRIKSAQSEGSLAQKIPVERFHVTQIKNNPMTFGDRPFVERFVVKNF